MITPDPADARRLYASWDGSDNGHRGPAVFTRTTDGGRSWEPARGIVQPKPQDYVQFSQLLVLPDGTLVDVYDLVNVKDSGHGIEESFSLQVIRSTDHGLTWSSPNSALTLLPLYGGPDGNMVLVDPETGQMVKDANSPSITTDNRTGNIYVVWEDGRFSNFQYNEIAFSMSTDGGFTWSLPIRVNQTPLSIPALNRQAFFPSITVASDGTIGISYYDFRFNDPGPGLPTDRWLVRCQPSASAPRPTPPTGAVKFVSPIAPSIWRPAEPSSGASSLGITTVWPPSETISSPLSHKWTRTTSPPSSSAGSESEHS